MYRLAEVPLHRSSEYSGTNDDYIVTMTIINPEETEDEILRVIAETENSYLYNLISKNGVNITGRIKFTLN